MIYSTVFAAIKGKTNDNEHSAKTNLSATKRTQQTDNMDITKHSLLIPRFFGIKNLIVLIIALYNQRIGTFISAGQHNTANSAITIKLIKNKP